MDNGDHKTTVSFAWQGIAENIDGEQVINRRNTRLFGGNNLNNDRGQVRYRVLLTLLPVTLLSVVAWLYGGSDTVTSKLSLTVGQQNQLAVVGNNSILKIRLAAGITARLWGDKACGVPIQKAAVIATSGTYTIPLADLPHETKDFICLLSSDNNLKDSVIWPPSHPGNTVTAILSHSPSPSAVGQAVSVGFSVTPSTPGVGTPTGAVTVHDGLGDSCTGTVAAASCSLTLTGSGSQTLTAVYSGNDNFSGSTSSGVTHPVNRTNTTTVISSLSPSPSVAGQPVAIGFTISPAMPGLGAVTGNVTVSDGSGNSCTGTVSAASCSIIFPTPGSKTLSASYAGSVTYNPSTSIMSAQTVRDFSISVSPVSQTVKAGSSVTFTLTVAPVSGLAGTINLTCGGTPPSSTCIMSASSITLSGAGAATRIVTVTTTNATSKGNYSLSFTGKLGTGVPASGGLTHSVTASLKVN